MTVDLKQRIAAMKEAAEKAVDANSNELQLVKKTATTFTTRLRLMTSASVVFERLRLLWIKSGFGSKTLKNTSVVYRRC
jgi:hypothetical protein